MTHIECAISQSVTLVSLLMSGREGVIGEQCRLGQSKYRITQIQKYVNTEKMQPELSLFMDYGYHERITPGYN